MPEDARVQRKKMGQAVRAGLFKGLKDLDADARAAELKERLEAKGYEIAGRRRRPRRSRTRSVSATEGGGRQRHGPQANIIKGKRRRARRGQQAEAPATSRPPRRTGDEVDGEAEQAEAHRVSPLADLGGAE